VFQLLGPLPGWLVAGLVAGGLASVAVGVAFWVAERRFPSSTPAGAATAPRKRQELRAYLRAIDESFAEDHPVAGRTVAFYLPERDVAITFDPRTYFRIRPTETHPVLVEHEMRGGHLGARLPFETPAVGGPDPGAADPIGEPVRAAYRELGLSATASAEEVTAAYRRQVKAVHPDHGGDEDAFRRVREAYTTAKAHAREDGL
jgi:hypothetical protein